MESKFSPRKLIVAIGEKVLHHCSKCASGMGFSESDIAVRSVAKWICPMCGTLNEVEIEFKKGDV